MHAHNRDPHGHSEEMKARRRGGSTHRKMLKTGGACERKRGGAIPGEKRIKHAEMMDEEGRKRGGEVHGKKPMHRLDKKPRANGGAVSGLAGPGASGIAARANGGRMTPKSPFTGAGGHKPPFPHPEMPIDEGGEGKASQRKRGGRTKKRASGGAIAARAMGGAMDPTSGAGAPAMKRGGKRASGGAVASRKRGGRMEHDDGADAMPGERAGAPAKSRKEGGRLTAAKRRAMSNSEFALPSHGEGPGHHGAGAYPIDTSARARNALARGAQHASPSELATIKRKVHAKYPDIG